MNLCSLREGSPGEHKGISHALKHYLSPAEMWADLAVELAEEFRPEAVVRALGDVGGPPWEQWGERVQPALAAQWIDLKNAYHVGYYGRVKEHAQDVLGPDQSPQSWVRDRGRLATHLGTSGIVCKVEPTGSGWRMFTAFRPKQFEYSDHACPRRDPDSVSTRRRISARQADRWLAYRRTDGEDR